MEIYIMLFFWWAFGYILGLRLIYEMCGYVEVKDLIVFILFGVLGLLMIPTWIVYSKSKIMNRRLFEKKD